MVTSDLRVKRVSRKDNLLSVSDSLVKLMCESMRGDMRGDAINSVTIDLNKSIVDISKPYRRSSRTGADVMANCSQCSI